MSDITGVQGAGQPDMADRQKTDRVRVTSREGATVFGHIAVRQVHLSLARFRRLDYTNSQRFAMTASRPKRWMRCGCSSVVEHNLAKVGVEGSNPFTRSIRR